MEIGKSFSFVFEDESWVRKALVGGVVTLIPIVNVAALGYLLRLMRNVEAGAERPLPEWSDLGDYFVRGLPAAIAAAIYAIPILLTWAGVMGISAVASGRIGNEDALGTMLALCAPALSCLMAIYGMFMNVWLPAAAVAYARSGAFGAFFRFGDIAGFITGNVGGYIIALLVAMATKMVAFLVGLILCGIGQPFTLFFWGLILAHLLGQLMRGRSGAAPQPVHPSSHNRPLGP